MPIPLSLTETSTLSPIFTLTPTEGIRSQYLTALENKLINTCLIRFLSARTSQSFASIKNSHLLVLFTSAAASSITACKLIFFKESFKLPDSIFEISNQSVTKCSRRFTSSAISSTVSSTNSLGHSTSFLLKVSTSIRNAATGVFISCATIEINEFFRFSNCVCLETSLTVRA